MPFDPDNVVVRTTGANQWTTLTNLSYVAPGGQWWAVPPGFVTDFASIPSFVTWLIPRHGQHTLAAIIHDWLIADQDVHPIQTDRVFRAALRELGVPPVRRSLMWAGVRWGALTNGRHADWWADAPQVLAITALAAPVVVPVGLLAIAGYGVYKVAERIARLAGHR